MVVDLRACLADCPLLGLDLVGDEPIVSFFHLLPVFVVLYDFLEGVEGIGMSLVRQLVVVLAGDRGQAEWFGLLLLLGLSPFGRLRVKILSIYIFLSISIFELLFIWRGSAILFSRSSSLMGVGFISDGLEYFISLFQSPNISLIEIEQLD